MGGSVDQARRRSFFRLVKSWPPTLRDYRTKHDKWGLPPAGLTEEERIGWFGLSSYDPEDGAREQARTNPGLGRYIARYDIPQSSGIECTKTFGRGHWTLSGPADELHGCLAPDYRVTP